MRRARSNSGSVVELIDRRFKLANALSRGAEIAQVFALSGLRFHNPRESVMGHCLVARRLGAQFSKREGFALELIAKSTYLAPE
jgi:hypothetical protein